VDIIGTAAKEGRKQNCEEVQIFNLSLKKKHLDLYSGHESLEERRKRKGVGSSQQ
jgi:hypothetical protein